MNEREKLMRYTWVEFLKTPFSLIFFAVCIVLGYIIYDKNADQKERIDFINGKLISTEKRIQECMDKRVEESKTYKALTDNLEINNKLNKE